MSTGVGMAADVESYIHQWLQTATKGNVKATFATQTDRMLLDCSKCDQALSAKIPEPGVSDYAVQEFVKLHAHNGVYQNGTYEQQAQLSQAKNFADSAGGDGVIVNGKKIYWKKDTDGNIIGVSDTIVKPVVVVPKAPKESTGRKFR